MVFKSFIQRRVGASQTFRPLVVAAFEEPEAHLHPQAHRAMFHLIAARHILIDEAQADTSLAQYEILRALCGQDRSNVFMVADPAQSIYTFAGASSKFVDRFVEEFGASRHELTITFRCAEAIVDVARRLFVTGKRSKVNPLLTSHSIAKGLVCYETFTTEADEARAAVEWAEGLVRDGLPKRAVSSKEDREIRAEHIAILARSRIHLKATLAELDERGLDYHFAAGEAGVFDSDHYRAVLYGLKLLANSRDVATAKTFVAAVHSINDRPRSGERATENELAPELSNFFHSLPSGCADPFSRSPCAFSRTALPHSAT